MEMKQVARTFAVVAILLSFVVLPARAASRPGGHWLGQMAPAGFGNLSSTIFINEIHYDNTGTDAGEAIEIAGPAGTDLAGWSLVLYNGSTGAVYDTDPLSGVISDQNGGYGTAVLSYPVNGIQNGSPDGIALVDASSVVVQFLSYEGTFTAVGGPANGLTSTDIGVSENGSEPLGRSLQLTGAGPTYGDFTWNTPATSSFGAVNSGQAFVVPVNLPVVAACGGPLITLEGFAASLDVSATDSDGTVIDILINDVAPSPAPGSIDLSDVVPAGGPGGTANATVSADAAVPVGAYTVQITATNDDSTPQTGTCSLSVLVGVPIHAIQGSAHSSPMRNLFAATAGIVTARSSNGFWLQDPNPDADDATSEGIFVFTSSAPTVAVGDGVGVGGTVVEFRPGGSGGAVNLTTTEISNPGRVVTVMSSGNALPAATILGDGGRLPPDMVIDDDADGDVETSGVFDPASDGIDFYESLEGMLVQVNDAVAVGPRNAFGEIAVVADDGAHAGVRTARGGIVIRQGDFNPERIILDDVLTATPSVNVGDHFTDSVVGVLDYSFGNFKLLVTGGVAVTGEGLGREAATGPSATQLSVGSFNVENLDPGDPQAKFDELASLIVDHLASPGILAIEEVQDNNGPANDAVVDAGQTFARLIGAIQAAGGPTYDFRQINPVDDQDGGEPGGNIRVGFLFRTDRGLSFVDRPGGTPTSSTAVVPGLEGVELSASPGRIDPANSAFDDSRKSLAAEFDFRGDPVFVIVNHFNSKGGDQPLFGHFQPPTLFSETQRLQQAQVVHDFVAAILDVDADANVVVLGDLNDFEFSAPLQTLKGDILVDLVETLPQEERYTYVFDGNSQVLDHILVSGGFSARPFQYDIVHVNSEFADQASDHEPEVVRLSFAPSLGQLEGLLQYYADMGAITGNNTLKNLMGHLESAGAAQDKGNDAQFRAQLQAFANQVLGFSPKFVSEEAAAALVAEAELLLTGGG
jgi:predicted extracellular nuclease